MLGAAEGAEPVEGRKLDAGAVEVADLGIELAEIFVRAQMIRVDRERLAVIAVS